MCGRFVLDRRTTDLVALFDVDSVGENLPEPSWNIAPTQSITVLIDSLPKPPADGEPIRRLEAARWGLVPPWAKSTSDGPPLFNARSETVAEKSSFRNSVKKRRAVIPATGYYEWHAHDDVKTPQFISLGPDEIVLFAGLYEWWKNPAVAEDSPDRWLLSATILTRESAGALAPIHDRMPVFLDADFVEEWLDPIEEGSAELVDAVVAGAIEVADRMVFHEVGAAVGSVKNNSAELIEAI
jgi:putative SOS response-associated peptidase YedK